MGHMWAYAESEGPDQPVTQRSPIRPSLSLTESLDTTECMNGEKSLS